MEDKINKLYSLKWNDKYFTKLALLDHIRECLEKDNYLKAKDIPKDSDEYKNLDKELMDLKIILEFYFKDNDNLFNDRLNKFYSKLNID